MSLSLHHALSHFPIALLVAGAAALVASAIPRWASLRGLGLGMSVLGALLSIPTVAVGLVLAADHGHHGEAFETHRLLGVATLVVAGLGLVCHLLRHRVRNADVLRNVLFLAAAALVVATGYEGGEMGHGEGAGGAAHDHATPSAPDPAHSSHAH